VPVDWVEDLDSRVDVAPTALKDVKGLLRVRMGRLRRRISGHHSHDAARRIRPLGEVSGGDVASGGERADGRGGDRRAAVTVGSGRSSVPYSDDS
jgi:hypothetical protein